MHAPGWDIGYSGLIFFIQISAFLLCSQEISHNRLKKRAVRLLLPWLFWSFIYGFLNLAKGRKFIGISDSILATLLTGTYIHLWYLPFMFICSLALSLALPVIRNVNNIKAVMIGAIFVSGISLITSSIFRSEVHSTPFAEWLHAVPAVVIGSSASILMKSNMSQRTINMMYLILILMTSIISLYIIILERQNGLGIPYLIGTIISLASIRINSKPLPYVQRFSDLTMGIYLIHPLLISIIHRFFLVDFPAIVAFASLIASTAIIFFIRSIKVPFFMNGFRKVI